MGKNHIFCMNCGQKLPAEAKFCFACGQRVETDGCQDAAGDAPEAVPCRQEDMGSPEEIGGTLTLAEFRAQAPSRTGFREQLLAYRKSLPHSWDHNAFVGILLGVGGPKHGDAACMNFAIGQGDNGNNTKKTLDAKGLMPVFEKYKGKNISPSILLSDVEEEIVSVVPDYAEIRRKFHEIVFAQTGGEVGAEEGVSAPKAPAAPEKPQETDPSCFEVEGCDGGCRVTKYTGPKEGTVVIPARIDGKKVVEIGEDAFSNCESLTGITIPDGVTEIGKYAFSNCKSLTSITIPGSVTEIDKYAFSNCKSLTSITIPGSVTEIDEGAFASCESLTSITIPDGVTEIASYMFYHCYGLTSVAIPASVTKIGDYAFCICKSLTGMIIPDGVTKIGDYAFSSCESLTSITIPDSVTQIDYRAFCFCTRLTDVTIPGRLIQYSNSTFEDTPWLKSLGDFAIVDHVLVAYWGSDKTVTIPDGVTKIGAGLFYQKNLTGVIIPKSVTEIAGSAFWNCTSLTDVIIPEGVTKIGGDAFEYCDGLINVTIPKSVTEIGRGAFQNCYRLTIHTPAGSAAEAYAKENSIRTDRAETIVVFNPKAPAEAEKSRETGPSYFQFENCNGGCRISGYSSHEQGALVIPARINGKRVIEIGEKAFEQCANLTGVTIPDSVTVIGDSAFERCKDLTGVTIPDSVKEIGRSAFALCESLTGITIPDSVTKIGDDAFAACTKLTGITIPGSVREIGGGAFESCVSLTGITIPNGVTVIGGSAFEGCSNLTSVTIPASVREIGSGAFASCDSLTGVTIPGSVTEIGDYTFAACAKLTSITIPGSVTKIDDKAFEDCDSLTIRAPAGSAAERYAKEYGIPFRPLAGMPAAPAKVQARAPSYFEVEACAGGCRIKKYTGRGGSVVIPSHIGGKKVVEIGEDAFAFCRSLTSLTIPDGVMKIGKNAFEHCANLTSITIPGSVTDIVLGTFFGCDNLTVRAPAGSYAAQCPAVWWFPVQPL